MKVVLDTNVLISGFLTLTGVSQYVLNTALKRHTLILSTFILEEFERIFLEKLKLPEDRTREVVSFLKRRAVLLEIEKESQINFSDKKDIPILALIHAASAHYLVTGDKKLLAEKKFGQTLFLSPREALEVL